MIREMDDACFRRFAFGYVADRADKQMLAFHLHFAHTQLHWEGVTVSAAPYDFARCADRYRRARG